MMRLFYYKLTTIALIALGAIVAPVRAQGPARLKQSAAGRPYYSIASGIRRLPAADGPDAENEASPSDILNNKEPGRMPAPMGPPMKPMPAANADSGMTTEKEAADKKAADEKAADKKAAEAKKKEDEARKKAEKEITTKLADIEKKVKELSKLKDEFERVDKVEKALDKHLDSIAKKAADAAKKPQQKFFGRIHLDTWSFNKNTPGINFFENDNGNDPQDRIAFRRIRLGMKGDIAGTMFYKVQTEFNDPNDFEYRDLYIGWKELPCNQVLILGNQKRPLGLDHLNSSRYNTFMERPLVIEALNEDTRRLGLAMYGYNNAENMNWTYGVYNLERTADDGRSIGDSLQLSLNGRISGSPWYDETSGGRGYLHLGAAAMYARPDGDEGAGGDVNNNDGRFRTRSEVRSSRRWLDTGRIPNAEHFETAAVEAMLNIGAFQLVSEYQTNWTQVGGGPDLFFHGGYVQASYFLTGEHIPLQRTSGTIGRVKPFENFFLVDRMCGGYGWGLGAWQIAARYSHLDITDNNITGGVGNNLTAGLNWWWTPYSRMQANYIYGDITQRGPIGGFSSGSFHSFGMRFMVDF